MRPPRTGRRLIRFWQRSARGGLGVAGKSSASVGSLAVVVPGVLGQDGTQMPLTEDQHRVGGLGPDSEPKPLRVCVAWGLRGGILIASIPASARTASNDAVNCPARSRASRAPRMWEP